MKQLWKSLPLLGLFAILVTIASLERAEEPVKPSSEPSTEELVDQQEDIITAFNEDILDHRMD